MFKHKLPYAPFIFEDTEKLIVGTLPPPRFSTGELLPQDVDFCYGSFYNSLWLYIDKIYALNLEYNNTHLAIEQRKNFLRKHKIGVCDIVDSCTREKIDASDVGMRNVQLRDLIGYIKKHPSIHTLLFTGGNSMNGPEYFFRKHLKDYNLKLDLVSNDIPRLHQVRLENNLIVKTVSLTSPSGSANRAIGSNPLYKKRKLENPKYTTFDFRVDQYSEWF
ncbi:hypothetical protein KH5_03570 [Urechidicola sp. KH5]